jgi:hypothetical protein
MDADKKTLIKIFTTNIFLQDFDKCFEKDVDNAIYEKYNLKKHDDILYNTTILLMDKLSILLKTHK